MQFNIAKSQLPTPKDFCFIRIAFTQNEDEKYDHQNSEIIGFIDVDEQDDTMFSLSGFKVLISFAIKSKYQNMGIMTEALNMRIDRYNEYGFNILPAYVKGDNPASEKVLAKCGFIKIRDDIRGTTYVKRISMAQTQFENAFKKIV